MGYKIPFDTVERIQKHLKKVKKELASNPNANSKIVKENESLVQLLDNNYTQSK